MQSYLRTRGEGGYLSISATESVKNGMVPFLFADSFDYVPPDCVAIKPNCCPFMDTEVHAFPKVNSDEPVKKAC